MECAAPMNVKLHRAVDVGSSTQHTPLSLACGDDLNKVGQGAPNVVSIKGQKCGKKFWRLKIFELLLCIVNFMIWGLWGTLLRGEISEKPNGMMKLLLLLVLIKSLPWPLGWISMMECVSLILLCKIQIIALWFFLSLIHTLQGSENGCLDSKQCGL